MKMTEEEKGRRRENINGLLSMLRSQLDGLCALDLTANEKNALQGIFPHLNHVQDDVNRLFPPVKMVLPGQAPSRHGGIAR